MPRSAALRAWSLNILKEMHQVKMDRWTLMFFR